MPDDCQAGCREACCRWTEARLTPFCTFQNFELKSRHKLQQSVALGSSLQCSTSPNPGNIDSQALQKCKRPGDVRRACHSQRKRCCRKIRLTLHANMDIHSPPLPSRGAMNVSRHHDPGMLECSYMHTIEVKLQASSIENRRLDI